jgi:hypothetical protein
MQILFGVAAINRTCILEQLCHFKAIRIMVESDKQATNFSTIRNAAFIAKWHKIYYLRT